MRQMAGYVAALGGFAIGAALLAGGATVLWLYQRDQRIP